VKRADELGEICGDAVGVGRNGGSSGLLGAGDVAGIPPMIEVGEVKENSVGVIDDRPKLDDGLSSSPSSSSSWASEGAI